MAKFTTALRESQAVAFGGNFNSGFCRIYSGTRPTDANTALSGNTLLADMAFGASAFTAGASDGVVSLTANIADASADNTGTATFARCFASNGTTVLMDMSLTATGGGGEVQINTTSIVAGGSVTVTAFTITQVDGA